jgi:rod shape determining protein RodA
MLGRLGSTRSLDWPTLSIYIGMVALGWLMIYAVTLPEVEKVGFIKSAAGKQLIWMVISFFALALIYSIDWKFWQVFAYLIYSLSIISLIGVLIFGQNIKGATSWYAFGGFSIQPSEFAKFGTALALSAYLGTFKISMKNFTHQITAFAIIAVPPAFILLQPDMGSAIVFLSFMIALYREGLSPVYFWAGSLLAGSLILGFIYDPIIIAIGMATIAMAILAYYQSASKYWLAGVLVAIIAAVYAIQTKIVPAFSVAIGAFVVFSLLAIYHWARKGPRLTLPLGVTLVVCCGISFASNYAFNNFLKPHQKDRINVWLNPEKCDPRGSLYNLMQSKMAISSGGFWGKGVFQGKMTKLNYVPEQSTDFIFCTVGEEHGFIGSFVIIALFTALILRLTVIAERQRSTFSRVYAYALAGIFFIHFLVNIGMTMGLVPIIGIPLPFISKGGSALLSFSIMIGVLLKLDRHRYNV